MGMTLWLKLRNSSNGLEITLENDYSGLCCLYPDMGDDCKKLNVWDINDFIDHSEMAEAFADEIPPGTAPLPPFMFKPIGELIRTLAGLTTISGLEKSASGDISHMLETCRGKIAEYDEAGLVHLM